VGTDIHYFAERRTPHGWELCTAGQVGPDGQPCGLDFYCGEERNYALFAILADVKRLTNSGFEPIAPPRGFPDDSPTIRASDLSDGGCYHNATWLTLRVLLEFPWQEKKRQFTGWVDAAQYRIYKETGRPQAFVDRTADLVSNEEMERLLREGRDTDGLLTLITFGIPYAEFAGPFVTETLPLLRTLGEPDDVRLVLYFDS
jgi:hypothetical protein